MAIVVNNNIASLVAQRNLTQNTSNLSKTFERLSSGFRINKAADDAAGLSISESLRAQIKGNAKAINNIQDGINMLQIAEGGLEVIGDNLQRIRELTVQAVNETNSTTERQAILNEIYQRVQDITRVANSSKFNQIFLLNDNDTPINLQIGTNSTISTNVIDIRPALPDARATTLGITISNDATNWTTEKIRSYMNVVDSALNKIISKRSTLGAYQTRLESALENLSIMNENITASESRIRDVDIAQETASMTKFQILQQASASILKQTNQLPSLALALLS